MLSGAVIINRLRSLSRQISHSRARRKLIAEGYDALFQSDDLQAHPPEFDDLWSLVNIVRDAKPVNVLEYGTGWSTYVIAETLARTKRDCRLTVVELDQHWLGVAESRLKGDAKSIVSFCTPEVETLIYNSVADSETNDWYGWQSGKRAHRIGVATIAFPGLYELTPDLIYIDGPGKNQVPGYAGVCRESGVKVIPTIISDPLFMKGPFTVCVDGRHAQASFLKANLPPIYDVKIDRRRKRTVFTPTRRAGRS